MISETLDTLGKEIKNLVTTGIEVIEADGLVLENVTINVIMVTEFGFNKHHSMVSEIIWSLRK